MTPIEHAQLRFERLTPQRRADLMVLLGIELASHARAALAAAEPDVVRACGFLDMLLASQKTPLRTIGSYLLRDPFVESVGTLFQMAETLGVGSDFEVAWDRALSFVRSSALGPGANSNGNALAGITSQAKAQIAARIAAWPIPAGATPIPLVCIDHGPDLAGMFHDRVEVEDDLWTADGIELVISLANNEAPPRGKTLDFDGERFVLI